VLRAIGLAVISSSVGRTTFLVRRRICGFCPQTHWGKLGGHVHPFSSAFSRCFTMRSSSE
jgi:hypothetical protein